MNRNTRQIDSASPKKRRNNQQGERRRLKSTVRWTLFSLSCLAYFLVSTSLWVFDGPFSQVRNGVIDTFDETRHGYLLRPLSLFTVSNSVIRAHALANGGLVSVTTPISEIASKKFNNPNETIQQATYHGQTYTAHIMIINNPKQIHIATTRFLGKHGETVQQMVADTGAIAGVNGGAFNDAKQQGTGAYPQGITIHNGKVITGAGSKGTFAEIAFTKGGQMIAGDYSLADLQRENVQEALSFGPVLLQNGRAVQTTDQGYNPRTAIGQTRSGKVILIVTDGRGQYGHLGASLADVTALMLKYHAVIAADLDGGSSTTMVYHNALVNTPVDLTGARSVATSVVVLPAGKGR